MNQRLVWNFEFNSKSALLPLSSFVDQKDDLKWEIRYFWPESEIIILNTIDNSLLDLTNYQLKHREDDYYLIPGKNYNIKRRHNDVLYKPLIKQAEQAVAYDAKIILSSTQEYAKKVNTTNPDLLEITQGVENERIGIYVKKEALITKLPTTPTIKIELARLEVLNKIYFSACVEGKSLHLVETIAKHLLEEHISCDYVTFLKNILKL